MNKHTADTSRCTAPRLADRRNASTRRVCHHDRPPGWLCVTGHHRTECSAGTITAPTSTAKSLPGRHPWRRSSPLSAPLSRCARQLRWEWSSGPLPGSSRARAAGAKSVPIANENRLVL